MAERPRRAHGARHDYQRLDACVARAQRDGVGPVFGDAGFFFGCWRFALTPVGARAPAAARGVRERVGAPADVRGRGRPERQGEDYGSPRSARSTLAKNRLAWSTLCPPPWAHPVLWADAHRRLPGWRPFPTPTLFRAGILAGRRRACRKVDALSAYGGCHSSHRAVIGTAMRRSPNGSTCWPP
jgi:hypothetical protein